MEVHFEGMNELMAQLRAMESNSKKAEEEALIAGAEIAQEGAQSLVRVDKGVLKEHIEISEVQNGEIEVFVDNQGKAYYGYMLEIGTSKMRAIPFMGPSFMRNQYKIERAMANSLRQSLGLMP